jgi:hypothetical protein
VCAVTAGQLAHPLNGFVAALADDVGRAKFLREGDPVRVAAEQDDLLGAEAFRGDHTAKADGAVADDSNRRAPRDLRHDRGVVTCAHHVGQGEQRWHQCVVPADRKHDKRSVRLWDTHGLTLAAVDGVRAVPAAVQARAVQTLPAKDARAVRPQERRHHEIADLDGANFIADGFDYSDEFMPHATAGVVVLHLVVRPQVAAADRGFGDAHERVCRFDEVSVGNVFDPHVAGAVHDGCTHGLTERQRT